MSPPPSPRESAQISVSGTSTPSRPTSRYRRDNGYLFATTWITGVLAAAASILFGVWAPLSYKAAADGNRDNNAMLSSMLSSVSVANSIADAALSTASAQASLLEHAQSRLGAMGQLALYQFCATQTVCRTSRFLSSALCSFLFIQYIFLCLLPTKSSVSILSCSSGARDVLLGHLLKRW